MSGRVETRSSRHDVRRRWRTMVIICTMLAAGVAAACSGDDGETADGAGVTAAGSEPGATAIDGDDPIVAADETRTGSVPGADAMSTTSSPAPTLAPVGTPPSTTTDPPRPTSGPDAVPTTVDEPSTTPAPVSVPPPGSIERIVSLSATHTETLFTLGAGDTIVAVDDESDFPDDAQALQLAGLTDQLSDVSPVLALDPDLVVVGDDPTGLADRLEAAGVATWRGPRPDDVEGAFAQIDELGELVGRDAEAAELVASMRSELAGLREGLPADGPITYFHEIDPSLFTIAPGTFLDSAYRALGLTTIAPASDGEDFFQLSDAEIVAADPDVIVLADAVCCGTNPDNVANRSGWDAIDAVQRSAIVVLDDRLADRWGPNLVAFWQAVADAAGR